MAWLALPSALAQLSLPERRKWFRRTALALAALLVFSVWAAHGGRDNVADDWAAFDRQQVIVKSVSSDGILHIRTPAGIEADARLLGVDLPNSDGSFANAARATQAVRWLAAETLGGEFTVRLDQPQTRAGDGSLLSCMFTTDLGNLNEKIVRQGWAYADRRVISTLSVSIELAEAEAKKKSRGMWPTLKDEEMPLWRQEWIRQMRERRQRVSEH